MMARTRNVGFIMFTADFFIQYNVPIIHIIDNKYLGHSVQDQ
jgi:hypothetical protein